MARTKTVRREKFRNMKKLGFVYSGATAWNMNWYFFNRGFALAATRDSSKVGVRLCVS